MATDVGCGEKPTADEPAAVAECKALTAAVFEEKTPEKLTAVGEKPTAAEDETLTAVVDAKQFAALGEK